MILRNAIFTAAIALTAGCKAKASRPTPSTSTNSGAPSNAPTRQPTSVAYFSADFKALDELTPTCKDAAKALTLARNLRNNWEPTSKNAPPFTASAGSVRQWWIDELGAYLEHAAHILALCQVGNDDVEPFWSIQPLQNELAQLQELTFTPRKVVFRDIPLPAEFRQLATSLAHVIGQAPTLPTTACKAFLRAVHNKCPPDIDEPCTSGVPDPFLDEAKRGPAAWSAVFSDYYAEMSNVAFACHKGQPAKLDGLRAALAAFEAYVKAMPSE